jgi:hypothetical protein
MLLCDICSNAYALYRQHEQVCDAFSYKVSGNTDALFRPLICYPCAQRINGISKKILGKEIHK